MKYAIIPAGNGVVTHKGDISHMNLPDDAEIFDDKEKFQSRLSDFETE